jgi:L-ribulose-5-phosphate 4-epimerase
LLEQEGVIKYKTHFTQTAPYDFVYFQALETWRHRLYQLKLIGQYDDGVGYGNLSIRAEHNSFFITATQTGNLSNLGASHYTKVIDYDPANHALTVVGPALASSESATHSAIYALSQQIKAIFHIHSQVLWQNMLNRSYLHTSADVAYGTEEMAREIGRIYPEREVIFAQNSFVMAGHQDGIFAFGQTLDQAGETILQIYQDYGDSFD